jgi:hypothetical protein
MGPCKMAMGLLLFFNTRLVISWQPGLNATNLLMVYMKEMVNWLIVGLRPKRPFPNFYNDPLSDVRGVAHWFWTYLNHRYTQVKSSRKPTWLWGTTLHPSWKRIGLCCTAEECLHWPAGHCVSRRRFCFKQQIWIQYPEFSRIEITRVTRVLKDNFVVPVSHF